MPDFAEIRRRCHGMMRPEVYEAIHHAASGAKPGIAVEMGTAHGASTVCLALGSGAEVWTVDRFEAGSRKPYGDKAENLRITHANLEHYSLADRVFVVAADAAEAVRHIPEGPIGLLMLDMDGRIDRDMAAFFDRLQDGAPVIIDDCANRVRARVRGKGNVRIDQKHRLTWLLTKSLIVAGLLTSGRKVNETWFGRKVAGARFADWPADAALDAYREIVFATAQMQG